jgi:hypothetical protein
MISPDPKIIDLLNESKDEETPVSLEYFPPRTEDGVKVCSIVGNIPLTYLTATN